MDLDTEENIFASQEDPIEEFSQTQKQEQDEIIEDFTQTQAPNVIDLISQSQPDISDPVPMEIDTPPVKSTPVVNKVSPAQSKPKRPLASGYMIYCQSMRHIVKQDNPSAGMGQIAKLLGQRWKALTQEERDEYNSECKRLKKEWAESNPPTSQSAQSESKEEESEPLDPLPPDVVLPSKPPLSGYHIWASEERPRVIQELRGQSISAISKELSNRWKEIPEEKKAEYKQLLKQKKEEYELFWQENPDLIKYKPQKKKPAIDDPKKLRFPFGVVKRIVQSDPDVKKVSKNAYLAIGKAMELFLAKHAKDALYLAKRDKRKGIHQKDVATAVYRNDEMDFLRTSFDLPTSSVKRSAKKVRLKQPNAKKRKLDITNRRIDSFFSKKVES